MSVVDSRPIEEVFEQGQLAEGVQLDETRRAVVLYDLTLVEDDGPGASTLTGHGRPAPTTICGLRQARKTLHLDRAPARRAWLVLCAWPAEGETAHLRATVNGRAFSLRRGTSGYDWPALRLPASLLREGDNEVVLSCQGELGWRIPVAQREHLLRNDPERQARPRRSLRSTDGGTTWTEGLGDDGGQAGEFLVRLHVEQFAARGKLVGPVIDLASLAADGDGLPSEVQVTSLRVSTKRKAPAGTKVEVFVRSGETPVYDPSRWGEWRPCGRAGVVKGEFARFVQWRAVLTTSRPTVTPALEAVEVEAEVAPRTQKWAAALRVADSHNEEIRYTSFPFEYERFDEPQLVALRKQFHLDEVVAGAKTELGKMIALRHWVSTQWKYDPPLPDYPAWDAHEILRMRRGICVQYAIVYQQCALSLGIQTRFVFGYFPHVTLKGEHVCGHEINEYWSNELGKWVAMDAHQDECFVDRATGQPANMLELHEDQLDTYFPEGIDTHGRAFPELLPSKGLLLWKGEEAAPRREAPKLDIKWGYLHWMPRNNWYAHRFPEPLDHGPSWAWTGYRLWQDARTPRQWRLGHYTRRRSDIEWTLNQVRWAAAPTEEAGVVHVSMGTVTPDFDTFLINTGGGWQAAADTFAWRLHPGRNRVEMRVRNRAGVSGRVSWIELDYALPSATGPGS